MRISRELNRVPTARLISNTFDFVYNQKNISLNLLSPAFRGGEAACCKNIYFIDWFLPKVIYV